MATLYGDSTNHWRAYANYSTADSGTATTVTVSGAGMESIDWGFELSGNVVSTTVTLTGKSSLTGAGSFYSGWGTTVQTSYASGSWSITRTTSAQMVTLGVTTVNASGYMDGTSSGSTTITVPALQSYTIKYDANGGTGAPASQTKYFGQSITLSTTKPTRQYYNFVGWATSASATSAAYQPGATYSTNGNLTLYAVWTQDYVKPTVKIISIYRCKSDGTVTDDGTYGRIYATWNTNSGSNATSLVIEYKRSTQSSSSWTTTYSSNPGASSGTVSRVIGGGAFNASYTYNIRMTVTDSGGSSTAQYNLQPDAVIFDIKWQQHQMGVGRPAPSDYSQIIDVSENIRDYRPLIYWAESLDTSKTSSESMSTFPFTIYDNQGAQLGGMRLNYSSDAELGVGLHVERTVSDTLYRNGMTFAIDKSGDFRVVPWTASTVYAFAEGFYIPQGQQLYWTTNGTTGTVTLSSSIANYNRIEIVYMYDDIYATQWVALGSYTNGITANLMLTYPDSNDPTVCWIKTRLVRISGTSITTVRAANYQAGSAQSCQNTASEIRIVRVFGYKIDGVRVQ